MNSSKEQKHIKISQTAVTKGYGSSAPIAEGGPLPPMESHVIVMLTGDELDIKAVMSEDVARNLKEQLSLHVK